MDEFLASGMPWKLFNFAVFSGLLGFGLRRSVAEFWRNRKETLTMEIDEASRLRMDAGKKTYDLEVRLARLDQETGELVGRLRDQGELEKKKMIEDARHLAAQMRRDSVRIMDQELNRAREELKHQVVEISVGIAERLLQEKMVPEDRLRLNRNYLKELEARL